MSHLLASPNGRYCKSIKSMTTCESNRNSLESRQPVQRIPQKSRTGVSQTSVVRSVLLIALLSICSLSLSNPSVFAQQFPQPGYYSLMGENSVYHMGELRDAERAVRNLYSGGYREGNVRWIDSSAYLALQGELRYQQGDFQGALTNFNDSIIIYLNMAAWPNMVDWRNQPQTQLDNNAQRVARITWGQPTRQTRIGRFPSSYQFQFGQDLIIPGENGNIRVPQAKLRPVDIFEITRSIALGIRRRDQILGPLSTVDETSRLLRSQLQEARNLVPASIPVGIGSILYGISVAGEGDFKKSSEVLQGHLQIDGMDHPLTPVALLQIGYNQYMSGDYRSAKATLGEASFSAAYFQQYDVFSEALFLAAKAHTAVNRDQALPELVSASEWARLHGLRMAQAKFAMVSAENDIENGDIVSAIKSLDLSRNAIRTTTLAKSAFAVRLGLLEKIAAIISGKDDDILGLRKSLELYRNQTLWWFRVEYLRNPRKRDTLTTSVQSTLVKAIARDPIALDWEQDPIDTLAFLTGDRSDFMMSDLDQLVAKRSYNDALLTSELIRRMEFLYKLPLGGRLMSLRELIIREPVELTPDLIRRQQEVRSRFNGLQELMDQAKEIRTELDKIPVNPEEDQQREWLGLVQNWELQNRAMERGFINLSVRRESIPLLFPPEVDLEKTQRSIPEKTICLVIKQSRGFYHVFLVTKDTIAFQTSVNPTAVNKAIRGLAKMWGHTNSNAVLQTELLQQVKWKALANSTLTALVPKSTPEFWDGFEELVIIPDGQFWYLPFETLALESKPESELLIDKLAIRYAPTLGLAFGPPSPRRLDRVAFYPAKINLKDSDELLESSTTDFLTQWPSVMPITTSEITPAEMGPLVDGIIMWNEVRDPSWPIDNSRPKKQEVYRYLNLDAWPYLPNNGPEFFAFSGANTAIADGLRKRDATGDEIGYYATLLMASGVKSMVLPRWNTGSDLTYKFQVNLAKEMQTQQPTATAFRNAVSQLRKEEVSFDNQARVRTKKTEDPIKADHPFFWANHMVVDRGLWYLKPEAESATPLLKAGGSETEAASPESTPSEDDEAAKPTTPPTDGEAMNQTETKDDDKKERENAEEQKAVENNSSDKPGLGNGATGKKESTSNGGSELKKQKDDKPPGLSGGSVN